MQHSNWPTHSPPSTYPVKTNRHDDDVTSSEVTQRATESPPEKEERVDDGANIGHADNRETVTSSLIDLPDGSSIVEHLSSGTDAGNVASILSRAASHRPIPGEVLDRLVHFGVPPGRLALVARELRYCHDHAIRRNYEEVVRFLGFADRWTNIYIAASDAALMLARPAAASAAGDRLLGVPRILDDTADSDYPLFRDEPLKRPGEIIVWKKYIDARLWVPIRCSPPEPPDLPAPVPQGELNNVELAAYAGWSRSVANEEISLQHRLIEDGDSSWLCKDTRTGRVYADGRALALYLATSSWNR